MSTPSEPDLSALSPLAQDLAAAIARVASDLALVVDREGVISAVAAGAAVQAQACGRWVGRRWIDTASDHTRPKIQSLLDEVASRGVASRRREVNHPGLDGRELPVTWSAIRLGADGPVLAVGRDLRAVAAIQQRFVEAQQDMERHYWQRCQAENRYQLLFQIANDALLVLDASSLVVLEANAATAELLGCAPAELLHRPLTDSLPPGVRSVLLELLVNARSSGRSGETRVRGLGLQAALDIAATPFSVHGRRQLMLRARRDGEPSGATDGLALSRMAEFVETTPDAVVITDAAGGILMANPAFLRLARQTDEAPWRSRPLPELLFDPTGAWAQLVAQVRSVGMVSNLALEVGALDGSRQRVRASAAVMAEGVQARLGFVLRPDHRLSAHRAADDVLAGLLDQVGRVPLADLLVEVSYRAERQLIASALQSAGDQLDVAAAALGMTPEALTLRMQRHSMNGAGVPSPEDGPPPLIN